MSSCSLCVYVIFVSQCIVFYVELILKFDAKEWSDLYLMHVL